MRGRLCGVTHIWDMRALRAYRGAAWRPIRAVRESEHRCDRSRLYLSRLSVGFVALGLMTVKDDVIALLSAEHNGTQLSKPLIAMTANYLVDVVEVDDVNQIMKKTLQKTFEEAWADNKDGADLPAMHVMSIASWLATPSVQHEVDAVSSRRAGGGEGKITEDEEKLFGDAGPTAREKMMLKSDKAKMGLSGLRILILSLALELGRVPPAGQVVACIYGSDPRLSDVVKTARKASMQTLTRVLENGDVPKLGQFLMNLVRDFSDQDMIEEAQLITGWWTETQSVCSNSWSMMAKYVRMYLDKYVGRGLPEPVDLVLLNRLGGGGSGGEMATVAADALKMAKDAKARADKAVEEATTLKSQLASLRNELNRVKSANQGAGPSAGGAAGGFKGRCNICGKKGHKAVDCPNKNDADDDAKDDE